MKEKTKKNERSAWILFFLMLVMSIILVVSTHAVSVEEYVDIVEVTQAKSKWCWAACAEIGGKNVYMNSSRTQWDIVSYLYGSNLNEYPNVSGYISDSASGSRYITYNNFHFIGANNTLSFTQIESLLGSELCVQAAAGYYDENSRNGGHVVVIFRSLRITGNTQESQYIEYFDPWDGNTHLVLFSSFCNGSYNGRIYDGTIYCDEE